MSGTPPFAARVIAWQRVHGRSGLPWQGVRDPYRIWLSEIMLQQTQVAAVLPYYARFLARCPDVQALAAAPADTVLGLWAGLGYYSRARNLHRCAQVIVADHGGAFPRSAAALAELPGIGRSTAAAIAAFAFGERAAILDGNVKRVLARHEGIEGWPGVPAVQQRLWQRAEALLPDADIGPYTQGMMDLGAAVCLRRPRCDACPVSATCVALRDGRIEQLPAPKPARARPQRIAAVALVRDAVGAVLLERRPPAGLWGGLSTPPQLDGAVTSEALAAHLLQRHGLLVRVVEAWAPLLHTFTHFTLELRPVVFELAAAEGAVGAKGFADATTAGAVAVAQATDAWWIDPRVLADAPVPAPVRVLLQALAPATR